jgi:hypothetical protein
MRTLIMPDRGNSIIPTAMRVPIERAIVARGRTICVPDPTKPPAFVGREIETNRAMFAPATRDFGPGEEVELPRDEVRRLRGFGYLVDSDATVIDIDTREAHVGKRLTLK